MDTCTRLGLLLSVMTAGAVPLAAQNSSETSATPAAPPATSEAPAGASSSPLIARGDAVFHGPGNCYACHQMEKKELSYGTLGPSLQEYGKIRKFAPEDAKAAYAKIYDAQATQPCSNMPRFGHNKFLSEKDMKDLTAYLFDPESPVNK